MMQTQPNLQVVPVTGTLLIQVYISVARGWVGVWNIVWYEKMSKEVIVHTEWRELYFWLNFIGLGVRRWNRHTSTKGCQRQMITSWILIVSIWKWERWVMMIFWQCVFHFTTSSSSKQMWSQSLAINVLCCLMWYDIHDVHFLLF